MLETQCLGTKLALRISAQDTRLLPAVVRKLLSPNCPHCQTIPLSQLLSKGTLRTSLAMWVEVTSTILAALLTVYIFGWARKPPAVGRKMVQQDCGY